MSEKVKSQFETRCDQLFAMGLKFDFNRNGDGGNYVYHGINLHWTDITCMSKKEWDTTIEKTTAFKNTIDEKLKLVIAKNIETNTLPFLELGEMPVNLVIDSIGISYSTILNNEIICSPTGELWLDKIQVNCELPYASVLANAKLFETPKEQITVYLANVENLIAEGLNTGVKDLSLLLNLKRQYEMLLNND